MWQPLRHFHDASKGQGDLEAQGHEVLEVLNDIQWLPEMFLLGGLCSPQADATDCVSLSRIFSVLQNRNVIMDNPMESQIQCLSTVAYPTPALVAHSIIWDTSMPCLCLCRLGTSPHLMKRSRPSLLVHLHLQLLSLSLVLLWSQPKLKAGTVRGIKSGYGICSLVNPPKSSTQSVLFGKHGNKVLLLFPKTTWWELDRWLSGSGHNCSWGPNANF